MNNALESNLKFYLDRCLPRHGFSEVYHYAVFPAGKLFRPAIALAAFQDAGGLENTPREHSIWPFMTALEIHHAYTLVHDDLPAMDDDDMRRGRLATHKAFGEWQAILAGDGLSVASFSLLSQMNHPQANFLIKVAAHALGPKGLIHGQALDLSQEMTTSFEKLLLTHELKTARLIQLALLGGHVLAQNDFKTAQYKKAWRLGRAIGVTFQLLDDLGELTDKEISSHEKDVNPWLTRPEDCAKTTIELLQKIDLFAGKHVRTMLKDYFQKTNKKLVAGEKNLQQHILAKDILLPVMTILQRLS